MTPKEALDFLVKNLPLEAQQTTSIYHTAIRVLLQSITELEELKRDVARFMDLMDKYMTFVFLCDEETNDEYDELSKKLMKVGK